MAVLSDQAAECAFTLEMAVSSRYDRPTSYGCHGEGELAADPAVLQAVSAPAPPAAAAALAPPGTTASPSRPQLVVPAALIATVLIAAFLRFYRLESAAIFLDEDNYIQAALDMRTLAWPDVLWRSSQPPTLKLPLLFFVHTWFIPLVGDPVVAGRALAATSGVLTTLLSYVLGLRLGGRWAGLLTALLYAVSPIAVLHERMVLQDGAMTAAALAAILVGWTAIERGSPRLALGAALIGALAVQMKVPAVACVALLFALVGVGSAPLLRRATGAIVGAVGPVASYVLVMLSPLGTSQATENDLMVVKPLSHLGPNLSALSDAVLTYFPLGLSLAILVGAVLAARRSPGVAAVFLVALLAWTVPWVALSRFAPSRYYLPAVPYACALAALALVWLASIARARARPLAVAVGALAALPAGATGFLALNLVLDHRTAPMSALDRWQYQSGWPSGYGYQEAARYIAETAEPGSAVAYVIRARHRVAAGERGPYPDGVVSLGLRDLERVRIDYSGPLYLLVDDGRSGNDEARKRARQLLARHRRLREAARFNRPGAATGVSVLTTR